MSKHVACVLMRAFVCVMHVSVNMHVYLGMPCLGVRCGGVWFDVVRCGLCAIAEFGCAVPSGVVWCGVCAIAMLGCVVWCCMCGIAMLGGAVR